MARLRGSNSRDTLRGTNSIDVLLGLGGDDLLVALAGNDRAFGGGGNDVIRGGGGNDLLRGDSGRDSLFGEAGNDRLNGGTGADIMRGGSGNDIYYVDNRNDRIIEGGGVDRVIVDGDTRFNLAGGIENLTVKGLDRFDLGIFTGNSLANTIDATQGNDAGAVRLYGNGGNDKLIGGRFGDRLDGGTGVDTLVGRGGDDNYYVDRGTDKVIEQAFGGDDTVFATASYTLPAHVENLTLIGGLAINGTGNNEDNTITGNGAANRLKSGIGDDILRGNAGADRFVFSELSDSNFGSGVDYIVDFASNGGFGDKIDLTEIDADPSGFGDQAFRFIGQMNTQNDWPEVMGLPEVGVVGWRITLNGDLTILANTDTDSDPELAIKIGNGGAVDADWFLL
ncbi:MAG: hypothetical protein KJ622_07905 [Alphaproteobacteria bacterium]|nr:hypothetical protein [Alphaproteobacteria bacterium]